MDNVLILNKTFEGIWTEQEGNIAHEIIDFIKTDKGEHYIYNNPFGQCPKDICLANNVPENKKKRIAKYILLCSPSKMKKNENTKQFEYCEFYINYVAEIEEILHTESSRNNKDDKFTKTKDKIKQIIKDKEIRYNGKYLYDIYGNDDSTLLVTFKIKNMWQPKNKLVNIRTEKYKFQRNKGYIEENDYIDDYNKIMSKIEKNGQIDTQIWEKVNLSSLNNKPQNTYHSKTFLDLICKKNSEECYTNILQSILNHQDLLNKFCKNFDTKSTYDDESNSSFQNLVKRERSVSDGRIDISADNKNQRVIIENKIYSGLNGIHSEDKISQLSTYYAWGNNGKKPVCFIVCPNFKINEIELEINDKDPQMKNVYNIVGYKEIADFIRENLCVLKQNYIYKKYVDDFFDIFNNFGYKDKFEYFEDMFLEAINKANNGIIIKSAIKILTDHKKAFEELAK